MKNIANTDTTIQLENYIILEKIGEGGYGLVYKAEQISTGQTVAIKMIKFKEGLDPQSKKQQIARFERETQLCAEINHPNIVKLLDKGYTSDQEPFAIFEFIHGETLKDHIGHHNCLSAETTGALMGQVLEALAYAHSKGIVHRDLKPHNIMVAQTEVRSYAKILDFGIGAFTHEFKANDYQSLTLTQEVVGTPAYSAPEQLRGEPTTVKSDLYAWGLIFVECLTGQPVMKGNSVAEVFQQQLNATDVPLPASIAGHPIANILRKVLLKDPHQRAAKASLIFEEYTPINFSTLVGEIKPQNAITSAPTDATVINQFAWRSAQSEKRQLTVLCAKLSLSIVGKIALDIEILEAIQREQLQLCKDTGSRFGAYISGIMADTIVMYFGYPQGSDNDARRAGRTALELVSQLQKRGALLHTKHGIGLDIRIAMNTGTVLIKPKSTPEGLTTNTAFNLLYTTPPGHILVAEATKKLLDPYLEFDAFNAQEFSRGFYSTTTYLLTGERPTEALSNLSPRSADQKMIGREIEKEQILQVWKSVKSNHGQALLLKGQAGIGKSKMIYESKKELIAKGFVVRECRCLTEYQNNALYPIFEMLKRHMEIHDQLENMIPELETALKKAHCDVAVAIPVLCSWFSIPMGETYQTSPASPAEQKEILFDTLEKCIQSIDESKKFMLIVEDLHWIDPTSLDFIGKLLQNLGKENYFLLLTARPEFEPQWEDKNVVNIKLNTLPKSVTQKLVKGILGQQSIMQPALEYIVGRTDGIPLFVEDLTLMLLDQEYLILKDDTYQLIPKFDEKSVPITLKGLLNARLDRLGLAKETAQLASAIGREFTYDLLVQSSLYDESMVQADLNLLLEANLIYRHRRVQNEMYLFRHALIRDAAYDGMVSQLRKETHGRIAEAMERSFPEIAKENPFELARHLAEAEHHQKASQLGLKAIKRHIKNSANEEALRLHAITKEWVLLIKDEIPKLKEELELNICVLAAVALKEGWGSNNQYQLAKRNNELIEALKVNKDFSLEKKTDDYELKNDWALFSYLHAQSKSEEAKDIGERLIEKSILKKNHKVEMAISSFLGQSYFITGNIDKSEKLLTAVIEKFNSVEDKELFEEYGFDPYIFANGLLGFIYCFRGYPNKALKLYKNGVEYAKTTNNDALIVLAFLFMGCFLSLISNKKLCKKYVEEVHEILGDRFDKVWVSNLFYMIEDWVYNKTDVAEEKRDAMIAAGQSLVLSYYEPSMARTYLNQKKYTSATTLLEDSLERQIKNKERSILPFYYNLLGVSKFHEENCITPEIDEIFNKAITHSEEMNFDLLKLNTVVDYSEFLIKEKQIEKAKSLLKTVKVFCETRTEIKNLEVHIRYEKLKNEIITMSN